MDNHFRELYKERWNAVAPNVKKASPQMYADFTKVMYNHDVMKFVKMSWLAQGDGLIDAPNVWYISPHAAWDLMMLGDYKSPMVYTSSQAEHIKRTARGSYWKSLPLGPEPKFVTWDEVEV